MRNDRTRAAAYATGPSYHSTYATRNPLSEKLSSGLHRRNRRLQLHPFDLDLRYLALVPDLPQVVRASAWLARRWASSSLPPLLWWGVMAVARNE